MNDKMTPMPVLFKRTSSSVGKALIFAGFVWVAYALILFHIQPHYAWSAWRTPLVFLVPFPLIIFFFSGSYLIYHNLVKTRHQLAYKIVGLSVPLFLLAYGVFIVLLPW